ncbi:MAG: cyclic nucleotide-binding domain-containing protein [Chloroflexota bacterium]
MATTAPLSKFALFRDLPEDFLAKIADLCQEVSFAEGETVFREGEEADQLHFLLEGSLTLKVKLTSRPESITVSAVNRKYESFGWSGLVPPHHYTASAICEQDCRVLTVPGAALMELLNQNTAAGFLVMQRIAELIANRLHNSRQALLKTL